MAKILVIDDSMSVRKAMERALVSQGHTLSTAASGSEAMSRLLDERPDLVFCDLVLPDIDGFEIGSFLRATPSLSSIPIVFISARVTDEKLEQARAVGAPGILRKPFAGEELLAVVARLLPAGTPPPRVAAPAAPAVAPLPQVLVRMLPEMQALPGFVSAVLLQDGTKRVLASAGGSAPPAGVFDEILKAAEAATAALSFGRLRSLVLEIESRTLLVSEIRAGLRLLLTLESALSLGRARYFSTRVARELAAESAA